MVPKEFSLAPKLNKRHRSEALIEDIPRSRLPRVPANWQLVDRVGCRRRAVSRRSAPTGRKSTPPFAQWTRPLKAGLDKAGLDLVLFCRWR
jgi:hypothetical protein